MGKCLTLAFGVAKKIRNWCELCLTRCSSGTVIAPAHELFFFFFLSLSFTIFWKKTFFKNRCNVRRASSWHRPLFSPLQTPSSSTRWSERDFLSRHSWRPRRSPDPPAGTEVQQPCGGRLWRTNITDLLSFHHLPRCDVTFLKRHGNLRIHSQ